MKEINLLILFFLFGLGAQAQSRKYYSQFNQAQSYFNPAMTGYEGSLLRGLARNQWAGWEGAPKSYYFSTEIDFDQLKHQSKTEFGGKNAMGIFVLSDSYGAFNQVELMSSYAARVQIGEKTNLRLGAGLSWKELRLDGNNLNVEESNDPVVSPYLGRYASMRTIDFNLGISITHTNYYFSYSLNQANKGRLRSGDVFVNSIPQVSVFQAGYRNQLSKSVSVSTNFMFRHQADLPENIEINLKAFFLERLWLGVGHRVDYANSLQMGLIMNKLRFGYVYETPTIRSYLLPSSTHELIAVFQIFGNNQKGLIW
ncbi:type IX secretion system PorP/SprF family membrane protein [Algoriphagus aquaeductus]|uniref:Type IX secretion system PorP/SprF family membrane protein n=1 Tax=Algoriphagus aquaeductus TaxID=475299 RepID=A0A326RL48_9BACT|nr:PorP/SprF family type IX secretion system membrane protein [Algoriphagus aquaeductus]PZV78026.1 type IX secretion system PorP/SprF family membrane protein [Algoriphagus aquaeductus]